MMEDEERKITEEEEGDIWRAMDQDEETGSCNWELPDCEAEDVWKDVGRGEESPMTPKMSPKTGR